MNTFLKTCAMAAGVLTAATIGFSSTSMAATTQAAATSTETVTATCKDGTPFTGTSKKGACRGHKGVKEWGAAAPAAAGAAAATAATAPAAAPKAPTAASKTMPTTAAAGGGAGKVWVNSSSKVYHCAGSKWYGKTKAGEYMTEAQAKAQGNHADHGKACS
ncbi:hypothetical protein GCM10027278_03870 [Paralcaligenes ginsengisoli]